MYKILTGFLDAVVNHVFIVSFFIYVFVKIFPLVYKCLKIHQLNIKKTTKKRLQRKFLEKYQSLSDREKGKKATTCAPTV